MKRRKRIFRRIAACALCAASALSLGGCWNSRDVETLAIVRGLGIDVEQKDPGALQLTVQILVTGGGSKSSSSGGSGGSGAGSGNSSWNVSSTGQTVFEAIREMTSKSCRKLYFPHTDLLVIGNDAAKGGIQKYLDFFERDHEPRGKILLAVSETSAADILNVKSEIEEISSDHTASMIKQYAKSTSQARVVKLSVFAMDYASASSAAVAPLLRVVQNENQEMVEIAGTAVFKMDKMVGKLDKREGRGLLWVLGEVKSGIIVVKDPDGAAISCEIIRAKAKVTPAVKDGKIMIKVKVLEEGNIGENTGTRDLGELSDVAYLEDNIAGEIKGEILAAVKKAQELDADIFGFGAAIEKRMQAEWKRIKGDWDALFKTLEVEVQVDAKLRLSGKIVKPVIPEQRSAP